MKLLTFKVACLVAITSAHWILVLAALSIRDDLCIFHSNRVVLWLDSTFLPKINIWFQGPRRWFYPIFAPIPNSSMNDSGIPWMSAGLCRSISTGWPHSGSQNHYSFPFNPALWATECRLLPLLVGSKLALPWHTTSNTNLDLTTLQPI